MVFGRGITEEPGFRRRANYYRAADELVSVPQMGDNHAMPTVARVEIHPSQFPAAVQRDLLESLHTRRVNHKFHYDSAKQTLKWLKLHEAHSPSRNDADCAATYDRAFAAVAERIHAKQVHLIGLGCGGGQKDTRLLLLLSFFGGRTIGYSPCDVSVAMVLTAWDEASAAVAAHDCHPFVCDLATADDLPKAFSTHHAEDATRLITFFGMIPNFEPNEILPKLASLVRPNDWLLFSANLAPGPEYDAGVQRVLPQYDNPLTREWLVTFLRDLGVEGGDGEMRFNVEETAGLKRIVVRFHFSRRRTIRVEGVAFEFEAGEAIQLFFSYRYTPERVCSVLAGQGLEVCAQWITKSEEEGVFLCQRSGASADRR